VEDRIMAKQYIFKDIILVQKKAHYSCRGCFFNPIKFTKVCCEVYSNGKFFYPCDKNIIYVPKENDNDSR
jgi:hypothetical protein